MQNFNIRVVISRILSSLFYFIWIFYSVYVYIDLNNRNLFLLLIPCVFVCIPLFLYSTFFIRNEYKIPSQSVNNYIIQHFWMHIAIVPVVIALNTESNYITLVVSIVITTCIAIYTDNIVRRIKYSNCKLDDVSENRIEELILQDGVVIGTSVLMFTCALWGLISFAGKNKITIIVTFFALTVILISNYYKHHIVEKFNLLKTNKFFNIENLLIFIATFLDFITAESNMLSVDDVEKSSTFNIYIIFVCLIMLIPLIKSNKKIGERLDSIRSGKE
jgi:hypothetical protein